MNSRLQVIKLRFFLIKIKRLFVNSNINKIIIFSLLLYIIYVVATEKAGNMGFPVILPSVSQLSCMPGL